MLTLQAIQCPPHRETTLSIACARRADGSKYLLRAEQAGRLIYWQSYDWHVWRGHCNGQLLIDAFIAWAEAAAKGEDA